MMKNQMTVTEGAALIQQVADRWCKSDSRLSVYTVTRRAAQKLSDDPVFNLAAYLKYNYGPNLSGETDADWLASAEDLRKFS